MVTGQTRHISTKFCQLEKSPAAGNLVYTQITKSVADTPPSDHASSVAVLDMKL